MAEPLNATTIQSFPYPAQNNPANPPADTPLHIQRLAEALEKRVVAVYDTVSARDSKTAGKTSEGMVAYVKDTNVFYFHTGGGWEQFYPSTAPTILAGNAVPNNTQGKNGDIWVQY